MIGSHMEKPLYLNIRVNIQYESKKISLYNINILYLLYLKGLQCYVYFLKR